MVRLLGDGWDVVFRGKDGGEISGGGWRPRRREKGKIKLVAGKPGRKSLFCANFELQKNPPEHENCSYL